MTFTYRLTYNDYLQHQLYQISTSSDYKRKRNKGFIFLVITFIVFGIILYLTGNTFITTFYAISAVVVLPFFPLMFKKRNKKNVREFIIKNYTDRFDKEATLVFNEDHLKTIDATGESQFTYNALESITETTAHYFLKIATRGTLIIPKRVEEKNTLENKLKILSERYNFPYVKRLEWKW
ncbi:YcxB family protein [Abyssalbus ytuae]|uniref:YcxB family protein n=1 Tax=Abyssalbus ytuae TaxID=2926907 RepID=A0A9E6ZZB7_9FLAO|nr:YcxB family protein [Abyssalbus ytuae]UOB16626.1 YcxB family protein [Abyssalbus ytuae]